MWQLRDVVPGRVALEAAEVQRPPLRARRSWRAGTCVNVHVLSLGLSITTEGQQELSVTRDVPSTARCVLCQLPRASAQVVLTAWREVKSHTTRAGKCVRHACTRAPCLPHLFPGTFVGDGVTCLSVVTSPRCLETLAVVGLASGGVTVFSLCGRQLSSLSSVVRAWWGAFVWGATCQGVQRGERQQDRLEHRHVPYG